MKRSQRLQAGRLWLTTYRGKNIVRSYQNHFGVDRICALLELKNLGRPIDEAAVQSAKMSSQKRNQATSVKNLKPNLDSDFHHYYIAGYTENGFAYGITWEEAETRRSLENDP